MLSVGVVVLVDVDVDVDELINVVDDMNVNDILNTSTYIVYWFSFMFFEIVVPPVSGPIELKFTPG